MAFLIGLLTFFLVLNCLALILLVLIQLPKKEAGAGLAFGGAATDTLFGAGSGNVLTKATKYAAGIFFVLTIVIGIMQSNFRERSQTDLERAVQNQAAAGSTPTTQPVEIPPASEPVVITNLAPNSGLTSAQTGAAPVETTPATNSSTDSPAAE